MPFTALAQNGEPVLPPPNGLQVWTEGYALKNPDGGLQAKGVEQGVYWRERDDGKCELMYVQLTDPQEFEANKIRTSPPPLTTTRKVGECPIKKLTPIAR